MQTKGDQYERWKQATFKELHAFFKTAWKEPTAETKARFFAKKQKVVMQLLVFTLKPMTAEKRALGLQGDEYEKARICLQGQNHEGFQIHNSTNNADAHLLRLFLSVYASSKLSEDVPKLWEESRDKTRIVCDKVSTTRAYGLLSKHLVYHDHKQSVYRMKVTYPTCPYLGSARM